MCVADRRDLVSPMSRWPRRASTVAVTRTEQGFTLLEVLLAVAILGTLAGMAMLVSPAFVRHARSDSGIEQALGILRSAREIAITERRNVEVHFIGRDAIEIAREEVPAGAGTTVLRTVRLENGIQFLLVPGVPDTPDAFGNASATAFGPTPTWMFTSEGTFVDANGDVLNGTLFLAIPDVPGSARAITFFGPTGLLRAWRWNGTAWTE